MADKIFADEMFFELPSEKAPSFVKGKISIRVADFTAFLQEHVSERGFVTIDMKESQGGKMYCELFVPREAQRKREPVDEITPDDIPF